MGMLQKWASLFSSPRSDAADDAIHVYVECARCRARVHVRLDKRHDLSVADGGGYFVRKEIMDSTCFRLMAAEVSFDSSYRIQRQEIEGGRLISREEFEAEQKPGPPLPPAS
jgi:hypothetical protein